ncbi:MAG: glycosyltransferase [Pseudomonadota bacterium]
MRVMIVVTHLLGTGHLARALTLGQAFATQGHQVTVASGGMPVPHFDLRGLHLVQLPPLRSDGTDFMRLLDDTGALAPDSLFAMRQAMLLDTLNQMQPDVLITELFPFGRRILRDEFTTLLAAAQVPGRLILSSVRDILAPPSKPAKAVMADEIIQTSYDGVLVHADRHVVTLDQSWPVSPMLRTKLRYTGFVAPMPPTRVGARGDTILVSAGGGTVGIVIFETALHAARQTPTLDWHLLVGGGEDRRDALRANAPPNTRIEGPRPDFRELMTTAAVSISMCGYNTALDVLQSGVPAVLVPFDDGNEVEQGLRAAALARLPGVAVVAQADMTADHLLRALSDVRTAAPRPPRTDGMDGAHQTVRIVEQMLEARE